MARPASDISARIVHAARERFLLEGVDGASLRQIAKDAKTNIGMVYYYFPTKDDLFSAVVEDVYGGILREFREALVDGALPEARLARVYDRIARMSELEFKVVRLILREALISSVRLERVVQRFQSGHIPLAAQVLAEGIAKGRFRSDIHPLVVGAATFSLAFGPQVMHRLFSASSLPVAAHLPSTQAAAKSLAEVLLFGLAGPALRAEHKPEKAAPRSHSKRK